MLESTSSTYNETNFHSQFSFLHSFFSCVISGPTSTVFILNIIIIVCLHLPLSLLILYYGLKQWNKRSTSSATPMSHSDCFTYHLVSMELIGVAGSVLTFCAIYKKDSVVVFRIGSQMFTLTWLGEICFHLLTCLEHYLAVVHPIIYLNLRKKSWIRIRNIITFCVWLLTLSLISLTDQLFFHIHLSSLILSVAVVSFCNLSVLNVLKRPKLGKQVGGHERTDQSKKRAFYTVMAILGALVLKFAFGLIATVLYAFGHFDCVTTTIDGWFNLPSSLVLQLLFLQRTVNFGCKRNFP